MALDQDIKQYLENYNAQQNLPYSSYTPVRLRKHFNCNFAKKKSQALLRLDV